MQKSSQVVSTQTDTFLLSNHTWVTAQITSWNTVSSPEALLPPRPCKFFQLPSSHRLGTMTIVKDFQHHWLVLPVWGLYVNTFCSLYLFGFHSQSRLRDSPTMVYMELVHSSSLLGGIPLYEQMTIYPWYFLDCFPFRASMKDAAMNFWWPCPLLSFNHVSCI